MTHGIGLPLGLCLISKLKHMCMHAIFGYECMSLITGVNEIAVGPFSILAIDLTINFLLLTIIEYPKILQNLMLSNIFDKLCG